MYVSTCYANVAYLEKDITISKGQSDIREMVIADQDIRNNSSDTKEMGEVDQRNTTRMKKIVDQIGWPVKSTVGEEVSHLAWLLVQHADHDVDFQERCLRMMLRANPGDVEKSDIAYLTDRIRVNRGEEQLYGTQFYLDKHGVFGPRPIENESDLDQRRGEMELKPFEGYRKRMMEIQGR